MQIEHYQHYLQKLGIALWVPNDFVWPPSNEAVSDLTVVEADTHQPSPAPRETATVANVLETLVPNRVATSAPISDQPSAAQNAVGLTPICVVTSHPHARLTVVASPGNDPRASSRSDLRQSADNLLDNMLLSIGITAEHYNLVRVAREQDRDKQTFNGSVSLVCGQLAASLLFNRPVVLASMRGKIHRYGDHKIVVTYHPDELRKNPLLKKNAWQDLRLLAAALT